MAFAVLLIELSQVLWTCEIQGAPVCDFYEKTKIF